MWSDVELIVMEKPNRLFVDADSCPVKEEIVEIAFGPHAFFVASCDHHFERKSLHMQPGNTLIQIWSFNL